MAGLVRGSRPFGFSNAATPKAPLPFCLLQPPALVFTTCSDAGHPIASLLRSSRSDPEQLVTAPVSAESKNGHRDKEAATKNDGQQK